MAMRMGKSFKSQFSDFRFAPAILSVLAMCAPLHAGFVPSSIFDDLRFAALWPDLSPPQTPHPAVVRVIAPEGTALSLGSGTLIDKNEEHGLVVTNWHVVRDARGPVEVVFPGGFRSTAKVIRMDRDWDLAALLISKPPVDPVPLSTTAPKPGEPLSIAGYGSGKYKMQSGRCTQYLSPGKNKPFEMIEMSAAARQGDSGGPILNSRGELAGVLFGAGHGTTSGSYGGRVHQFLQLASTDLQRLPATNIAQRPPPRHEKSGDAVQLYANHVTAPRAAMFAGQINPADATGMPESTAPRIANQAHSTSAPPASINAGSPVNTPHEAKPAIGIWFVWGEELKALLAAFGVAAIVLQVLRSIAVAKG
jgi:hypothetical protein